MFLLDFERAYDRVEWSFITMMLEAFGFLPFFCKIVQMLLKDGHAQVDINGSLSDSFQTWANPLDKVFRLPLPSL